MDTRGQTTMDLVGQHKGFGLPPVGPQGTLEEVFWFIARGGNVIGFTCLKRLTLDASRRLQ